MPPGARRWAWTLCGKKMALTDIEQQRLKKAVGAFIEQRRPPPHVRPKLDLGFRVKDQSVEIFEIAPHWQNEKEKSERPVAKATFVRNQSRWKIYWRRADLKWHSYEPVPTASKIEDFLTVVDNDEFSCFWG